MRRPCKRKRIKCDEQKPSCCCCTKRNEKCDYSIRLKWGVYAESPRQPSPGAPNRSANDTAPPHRSPSNNDRSGIWPCTNCGYLFDRFTELCRHWWDGHQFDIFPCSEAIEEATSQYPVSGSCVCDRIDAGTGSLCNIKCYTAKDLLEHEIMSHTELEDWLAILLRDEDRPVRWCKESDPRTGKRCDTVFPDIPGHLWHKHNVHRKKWE